MTPYQAAIDEIGTRLNGLTGLQKELELLCIIAELSAVVSMLAIKLSAHEDDGLDIHKEFKP